jgi:hypothetical protein
MLRRLLALVSFVSGAATAAEQTLVVLDSWATVETHSVMFKYLEKQGHQLTFKMADASFELKEHQEWSYSNIILMASSVKGKQCV